MHLAVPKHDVLVIICKHCVHSISWIHRPNYLGYVHNNKIAIYILPISNTTITSNNNIIFYVTTKDIYKKGNSLYKNPEHNCVLQESCKTVRRWQRSILLVKGGHCVGDWECVWSCPIDISQAGK